MPINESDLAKLVNASGFPFQLAVEHVIAEARSLHGWSVLSTEHAWSVGDSGGFVDLLLAKGVVRLVVECKRIRGGEWVFLVPEGQKDEYGLQVQWSDVEPNEKELIGFFNGIFGPLWAEPATPEAEFCIVRGTGEGDKPMLERVAWGVLDSLPALAHEELSLPDNVKKGAMFVHVPVIVTNATLVVCRYDPKRIDLTTGDLTAGSFQEVAYLRFRKSLAHEAGPLAWRRTLEQSALNKHRTVLVSTAAALPGLLRDLNLQIPDGPKWPATKFRTASGLKPSASR